MGVQDPFDPRFSAEYDGSVAVDPDDPISIAEKGLKQGLVPAVQSIVQLSQHAANEAIRLRASQYIVDRNLGTIFKGVDKDASGFEGLLARITRPVDEAIEMRRDSFRPNDES